MIAGPGCVCQGNALFSASRKCWTKRSARWCLIALASGAMSRDDASICAASCPTGMVAGSTTGACEAPATPTPRTSAATTGRIHLSRIWVFLPPPPGRAAGPTPYNKSVNLSALQVKAGEGCRLTFPVEDGANRKLFEEVEVLGHVPASPAAHVQRPLGRDDGAEAVPLDLVSQAPCVGSLPGRASIGLG